MALFSGFLRSTQAPVAEPSTHNDLGSPSFAAILADTPNAMTGLGYSATAPAHRGYPALPAPNRRSRARTKVRRVQLNVDVSSDERRDLRAYAKRNRISMGAAVSLALGLLFDRDRQ